MALSIVIVLLLITVLAFEPIFSTIRQSTIAATQLPIPFLGINIALDHADPPLRQAALARLHATGFGWVRQRLDWGSLEPTRGNYDWSTSDGLIRDIRAADLIPIIVLDGSPAWARSPQDLPPTDNPFAPPADYRDFARFAAAFAARYRDQLTFYQIWDEPNIAPHWGNRLIEPVAYAQLLAVTATAIRQADPDALIVSAALAPTRDRGHTAIDEIYYLQRLYAAGAASAFDLLAVQPFGFAAAPNDERMGVDRLNFARARLIRQTMVAAGDGATPVWAVRYGWNRQLAAPWTTVSEADQVQFAVDALTLARAEWPWLTAMAWAIDQPNAPPTDPIWGFSLSNRLAAALRQWVPPDHATIQQGIATVQMSGKWMSPWPAMGYMLGLIAAVARILVLGRQLPWQRWRQSYRALPLTLHLLCWLAVALVYYLAVWPPLILLCWLAVTILCWWQPVLGLMLTALFIPFDAQHKEFALGNIAFVLAPSHLLLLALLPVGWRAARQWWTSNMSHHDVGFTKIGRPALMGGALALAWLVPNLLSAANVWHWSAYRQGLWDLVLMPLLAFGLLLCLRYKDDGYGTFPDGCTGWRLSRVEKDSVTLGLTALYLGGVAVAVVGLVTWLRGEGTDADGLLRLVGPYFSPNQAALYLERSFFLGLGLAYGMSRVRWFFVFSTGVIFIALLLTASRGALLLGLPAGLLVWAVGSAVHWRRGSVPGPNRERANSLSRLSQNCSYWLGGLVATCLLGGLWLWPLLGARLANSATMLQRLTIWQSSWRLWLDYFWVGLGPGGFFWRYPAYLPLGALDEPNLYHPHTLWLEFATGWGIGGLLWLMLFLWFLSAKAHAILRPKREHGGTSNPWTTLALLAAFAAALAHAQVDAFSVLPDLALWTWFALALLYSGTQKYESS